MARSLRTRLLIVLGLLLAAAVASAYVMLALYQQSTAARVGQASAMAARSCGAIAQSYRFYTAGWTGGARDLADPAFRRDLGNVVFAALRDREDIEGGLWQGDAGAFAYAFPTYEGGGPKTDVPTAEVPGIVAASRTALADDRLTVTHVDARSQSLLIAACPLPGPVLGLAAWTMTRVYSIGSVTYWQLLAGLAALVVAVLGASATVAALLASWSRHVRGIEAALAAPGGDLPLLPLTGERELDRIVSTLNDTGQRLKAARLEAERLGKTMAQGERLEAVGRMAAGVAHEIRSPIAAMRLKSEMALTRPPERKDEALRLIIDQVDRLNGLVSRLLAVCEREPLQLEATDVPALLHVCAQRFATQAHAHGTDIRVEARPITALLDPGQVDRAVACLLGNALQVEDVGTVVLHGATEEDVLILSVVDHGPGPPAAIADRLFEPFVTGRPESAGLGLSIVREIAEAHNGVADMQRVEGRTVFRVRIPWLAS